MATTQKHPKLAPKMWKRDEVLVLLSVYESTFQQSVEHSLDTEDKIWNFVSNALHDRGIDASAAHCKSKWNFLLKAYTSNPNLPGMFFEKIKQILDVSTRIDMLDEANVVESLQEEVHMLDSPRGDEGDVLQKPPTEPTHSVSMKIERVEETSPIQEASGMETLMEMLCAKIDALAESQHRQEARIEEIYQIQRNNQIYLLEIKKDLGIQ